MTSKREFLSTEIVNRGVIEDSGLYASSLSFSVRVRRGLPDFLNSVNLKYVKLGYGYLLSYGIYFAIAPVLMLILSVGLAKKLKWKDLCIKFDLINYIYLIGLLGFLLYAYFHFTPPSTYLIDFACYRPRNELKISKEDFIELARKSEKFDEATIEYQKRVLMNSGMGDETYLPRIVFNPYHKKTLRDGREEAAMVMYGAVDQLLAATQIRLKEIKILIVNCGVLNTTPSLSAMVINHYKLNQNIESFNLGGMGCAAGIIAIDLAKDLLAAYLGSYALVISTEVISSTWYDGKERDMLLPNCFFRMGAAAVLLSNHCLHRWRAKYELKQVVCTHSGMDNKSFKSIYFKEDSEGKQGLSINKDTMEVGGHALKANITTLGPLVLSVSEQFHFLTSLVFKNKSNKPYIPNYNLAFEHVCILATSKKVLDEIQKNLELTDEYMEASTKTLERFGNTSSSSVWYELAYLEANSRLKKGDRIWQVGFGSGFKCNSAVWKALKDVKGKPKNNPWLENSKN